MLFPAKFFVAKTVFLLFIAIADAKLLSPFVLGPKTRKIGQFCTFSVLALAMVGKMCAAGAYAIIYNYTVEIFPTVVRSSGTSFGSMSGRIGSIAAPLLHNLVRFIF